MSDIGVEVGQKMRLAIKAKLTELNCYVDDELPDYIMVMIANKRTKAQMKEDLSLFLTNETSFFVEWLHIVLKKLKQVHVTNPNVFKNSTKRKSDEYVISQEDYKKIKKEEALIKKEQLTERMQNSFDTIKSLTDDLPITANRLSEAGKRKIVLMEEEKNVTAFAQNIEDDFDIPLLSEINSSNEEELQLLEKRIKNVKSRLGLQVESDKEDDDDDDDEKDCLNIKPDPGEMEYSEQFSKSPPPRRIIMQHSSQPIVRSKSPQTKTQFESLCISTDSSPNQLERQLEMKRSIHARITFDKEKDSLRAKYDSIFKRSREIRTERPELPEKIIRTDNDNEGKKRSILDRLGKRPESKTIRNDTLQSKILRPPKDSKRYSDSKVSPSVLSRVGVMSKVSIPQKKIVPLKEKEKEENVVSENVEITIKQKNVASVIKVKPRVLPSKTKQANPSLLFKAVAEAQRSVSQTPAVGQKNVKEAVKAKTVNVPVASKDCKPTAPALFTKKYKELQLAAAKGKEELAGLDNKRSIIINKNKKAKLLEDEKLKLRILLTNRQERFEPKRSIQKAVDDKLKLGSEFLDDLGEDDKQDPETQSINSNQSDKSSRTPELLPKMDPLEEKVFLKRKITVERTPQEVSHVLDIDAINESDLNQKYEDNIKIEEPKLNQKFIVTLDGIDKLKFAHVDVSKTKLNTGIKFPEKEIEAEPLKSPMIKTRRTPSPIIFDTSKPVIAVAPTKAKPTSTTKKSESVMLMVPPIIKSQHVTPMKKVKEKCKYFPNCRQGDRCEFFHASPCKLFPNCKFAEQCNYAHPMCKFETSCTRKNCPYSHPGTTSKIGGTAANVTSSICKFFPNCSNVNCPYFHPKMCKYGLHCKNASCIFQHPGQRLTAGNKLTWRPDK